MTSLFQYRLLISGRLFCSFSSSSSSPFSPLLLAPSTPTHPPPSHPTLPPLPSHPSHLPSPSLLLYVINAKTQSSMHLDLYSIHLAERVRASNPPCQSMAPPEQFNPILNFFLWSSSTHYIPLFILSSGAPWGNLSSLLIFDSKYSL